MTWTEPLGTIGSVASLLVATLYKRNHDRNNKLLNIGSIEGHIIHMQVLLEYGKVTMQKLKSSRLSYRFVFIRLSLQFRGVDQGMKQA